MLIKVVGAKYANDMYAKQDFSFFFSKAPIVIPPLQCARDNNNIWRVHYIAGLFFREESNKH